jgi:ATP-binding cassette subfamily B multidrug efflux pump
MKSLRKLVPYFAPYRIPLAAGLFLVVASAAFTSVIPWLLREALDRMKAGAPVSAMWGIIAMMVAAAIVGGGFRYGMRELMNGVSRKIEFDLRNDLFQHIETLDAPWLAQNRTGEIMARLTNDLSAVRMAAGPAIMYLVNTIFGGVFALAFMLQISPRLTALALLPMIVLPVMTAVLGKAIHDRFEAVQVHFGAMTTMAQENISGTRIVRAYRQEHDEIGRFHVMSREYVARNIRLARLYGTMNPAFGLLAGLGMVIVLGVGGGMVVRGTLTVGSFVAFGIYLATLTWPMIALGWVTNLFQRGAASMTRLNEILDARPRVTDRTEGSAERAQSGAVVRRASVRDGSGSGGGLSIEFRNVGFHYPAHAGGEARWVLRNVSFFVPAGATLGVVGATGSGKSALMDLIPRLYDPQEGEILIDGVPSREIPLADLRSRIGYAMQENILFSDTVAANIGYGLASDVERDQRRIEWAARVAQLDTTVAGFPGKYDTMLGERGINLSGGQKQRAALGRALARQPGIVLLDDALSAVDTHTEAEILHSLRDALAGRTAVIASHRVSAIRDTTWTIVLEEGRIVEQGKHEDLLTLNGRYWTLLRRQQLEESIERNGEVLAGGVTGDTIAQ